MVKCPILCQNIKDDECKTTVCAVKGEVKESEVLKRIVRRNGWKFICKNCNHHNS